MVAFAFATGVGAPVQAFGKMPNLALLSGTTLTLLKSNDWRNPS
jgi:hypothetical protein